MLHDNSKKSLFPCHYFCNFHVDLRMVPCTMSILGTPNAMSLSFPLMSMSILRNCHVVVLNLGVQSPTHFNFEDTLKT